MGITTGPRAGRRATVPLRELLLLALLIALLLLGTLPPLINLGRFQHRIAGAIGHAIGRSVSMDSVSLQMLPWPGFRIQNLAVGEDPGFGQEPALRAPEVVVEPSFSSLWRGQFEISKVELTDASVNLVRNADGRWNLSSVLLQASHIANAPTGARHAGGTPRFPYIDATDTRINFKRGVEKLPFSILNADFSMWLARPDVWGLKLEGQPARTDLPMASGDTGAVRLSGEVHRATAFGVMPVSLDGEWSHAPLGQAGRLVLGRDTGWRGEAELTAHFDGEIDALNVRAQLALSNLHGQDFTPEQAFSADVSCRAHYSRDLPGSDAFRCRWPMGDGSLSVTSRPVTADAPRLVTLAADKAPVRVAVAALGLLHSAIPSPDTFSGAFDGELDYSPRTRQFTGALRAPAVGIAGGAPDGGTLNLEHVTVTAGESSPWALTVRADPVALGAPAAPVSLAAVLDAQRYSVNARGGASLEALDNAATALHLSGLPGLSPARPGSASVRLALSASAKWKGATLGSGATGSLHVSNVLWQPGWLTAPVAMPAVAIAFSPGLARWTVPEATLAAGAGAPLRFSASVEQAMTCAATAACETHFAVVTPELSTAELAAAFSGGGGSLLGRLMTRLDPTRLHLPAVEGSLRAQTLTLGRLPIQNASILLSTAEPEQGTPTLRIASLDGQALGGTLHLSGAITASGSTPSYTLQVEVNGAQATQAAALWKENWGPGALGGTASLSLTGTDMESLLQSAKGTFQASWQGGSLGRAATRWASWDAAGAIGPDGLTLTHGALSGTPATLTGAIGWDRSLHLALTRAPGAPATAITGTLAAPVTGPARP